MEGKNWTEGLGPRIRSIREETRLDQEKFGESIGVGRQSICSYETGRLMPARSVIERISAVYGVPPWWLLFGIEDAKASNLEFGRSTLQAGLDGHKLTPEQQLLVGYILDERTDAKQVARKLFSQALDL